MELNPRYAPVALFCADARNLASFVAPDSVHLVVTSPPYNVGAAYASYDDNLPDAEYTGLLADVFAACHRVMVDGARIAVVTAAGVGRNPWRPLAPRVAGLLTAAGFTLRGQIIWDKGSSGSRCSWGSFRLPTNPCLRDTTELIVVAHKETGTLRPPGEVLGRDDRGRRVSPWLDARTFMELAQDHWRVPPAHAGRIGHPAPFPVALVERLVKFYGFPGCHVLDPFAGSGTVGVAAANLGCRATLVDVDAEYCALAARRVAAVGGVGRCLDYEK
jgi:site-specific DNA-methyltransferase (adenine-specific)